MPGFNLFIIILSEIGIGLSVGLILTIIFSAAAVAGEKLRLLQDYLCLV